MIRAALAATLSGLWGVYNGFELCEAAAIPGKEEYFNSEKYEIKAWDYDRPGNIIAEITALNRIRRENTALHTHLNVEFLPCYNPNILYFRKYAADGNVLLIAISLDPFNMQDATIEIPLWRFWLADSGATPGLTRDFTWPKISRTCIRTSPIASGASRSKESGFEKRPKNFFNGLGALNPHGAPSDRHTLALGFGRQRPSHGEKFFASFSSEKARFLPSFTPIGPHGHRPRHHRHAGPALVQRCGDLSGPCQIVF